MELLAKGVKLTRLGLGFPQWCNDEVVIPGLVAAGYDLEDARDYTRRRLLGVHHPRQGHGGGEHRRRLHARRGGPGDPRRARGRRGFRPDPGARRRRSGRAGDARLAETSRKLLLPPAPWYSVLMDGCLERGRDLSPRPQVQQLRHPRRRLGQRRRRPRGGAHTGLRPAANRTRPG